MCYVYRPFHTLSALSRSGVTFSSSCLGGNPIARPVATGYGYSDPVTQCIIYFGHIRTGETWTKQYAVNILVIDEFPGNINRLCLISHDYR